MIRNVIIAISAIGGLALQSPSAWAEAIGEGGDPVLCKKVCVALYDECTARGEPNCRSNLLSCHSSCEQNCFRACMSALDQCGGYRAPGCEGHYDECMGSCQVNP